MSRRAPFDWVGQRVGTRLVVSRAPASAGKYKYLVRCSCGREDLVRADLLKAGRGCRSCVMRRPSPKRVPGAELRNSVKSARFRALKKGWAFEITAEDFLAVAVQPCAYCGAPPKARKEAGFPAFHGVDRVDSNLGYVEGNLAPACRTCNIMKSDLPVSDFLQHIKKILSHSGAVNA